jgi:hypothetical protein
MRVDSPHDPVFHILKISAFLEEQRSVVGELRESFEEENDPVVDLFVGCVEGGGSTKQLVAFSTSYFSDI